MSPGKAKHTHKAYHGRQSTPTKPTMASPQKQRKRPFGVLSYEQKGCLAYHSARTRSPPCQVAVSTRLSCHVVFLLGPCNTIKYNPGYILRKSVTNQTMHLWCTSCAALVDWASGVCESSCFDEKKQGPVCDGRILLALFG